MTELEKFLEERSKIPIPPGDVARVKLLAKELALGVHRKFWSRILLIVPYGFGNLDSGPPRDVSSAALRIRDSNLNKYFEKRWNESDSKHLLALLEGHGYVLDARLTQVAFDLLEETEPYDIFISYRRLDSSALALLVLARLKEHGLVPFVDMALEAGGNWHAELEERIKACDYFIILLSRETLASDMTAKEICWAIDSAKTIVPLWHGEFGKQEGFDLSQYIVKLAANWKDEELVTRIADIRDVILQTNAIRVTDESASGYNTAIVELLNRFGITP